MPIEGWNLKPISQTEIPDHLKSLIADCGLVLS